MSNFIHVCLAERHGRSRSACRRALERRFARALLCGLLACFAVGRPAFAQSTITFFYVRASAPSGGNGQSWDTAYNDLQLAIAAAAAIPEATRNVRVVIAQGTYRPAPPGGNRSASFQLLKGTQYSGGYSGSGANPWSRDPVLFRTALSGDLNGDDNGNSNRSDNSYHVVTAPNTDNDCVLDLLTIRGGNANGTAESEQVGGGLYVVNGAPYLSRLNVEGNTARVGGGIYGDGNSSSGDGLAVVGSTFVGNQAVGGATGSIPLSGGGAMALRGGGVTIDYSTLNNNSSSLTGGAITTLGTSVSISQSIINQNTSVSAGGAIRCDGPGSLLLTRCVVNGNRSTNGSTIVEQPTDTLTMVSCLVSGNVGGAAVEAGGSHVLYNCTISGNWGGGLRAGGSGDSTPRYFHSIFWGNWRSSDGSQEQGVQVSGGADNFRFCFVQNGSPTVSGSNYLITNPQFQIPPTDPRSGNPATWGDCRLLATSPAVDSGSNAESGGIYPFDLDGLPRFINGSAGTNPSGPATIDRGCFEFNPNCPTCPNERLWYNGIGGNWSDAANWVYGTPGAGSTARVPQQYGGAGQLILNRWTMNFTQNASLKRLIFESAQATLDLNGNTLNLTDTQSTSLTLGNIAGTGGDIEITDGRVTATGVTIAQVPGSSGRVRVSGSTTTLSVTQQDLAIGYAGSGVMLIDGGARVFARSPSIGDQPTGSGSLRITGPGSRMDVPILTTVNNGTITLESGGTIQSPFGTVLFQGGVLSGDGVATGTLVNYGLVQPRAMTGGGGAAGTAGVLTIAGDYAQIGEVTEIEGSTGRLSVRLIPGPAGSFSTDRLSVSQSSELAGALVVEGASVLNLAQSATGTVLDSPLITGRFDLAVFPGLTGNKFMRLAYPAPLQRGGSVNVSVDTLASNIDLDPASSASVSGQPNDLVLADFDTDGDLDLALAVPDAVNPNTAPGQVVILRNAGNTGPGGSWAGFAAGQVTVNVGVNPRGIAAGRFNADTAPDLAVANFGSNTVSVLTNPGTGGTPSVVNVAVGVRPVALVAGVLRDNSGGAVDLAVANQGSNSVTLLYNTGGAFGLGATLGAGASPSDITAAALNPDDSTLDLAVTNRDDNTVAVYYRLPGQTLPLVPSRVLPVSTQPEHIEPGGLDNPKDLNDLAVSNSGSGSVSILLNNDLSGAGAGFRPKSDLPCGSEPGSIALGDLDNDDDLDLAVVVTAGAERVIRVFRNDQQPLPGGGFQAAFAPVSDEYAGQSPVLAVSGNVDGNAGDDLIGVNEFAPLARGEAGQEAARGASRGAEPNVSTKLSLPPPCDGDFNRDGAVGTPDLVFFLGRFGQAAAPGTDAGRADFSGNGVVDTPDLVVFLGRFGQVCL